MFYSLYLKYLKEQKRPGQITYQDPETGHDYCEALTEAIKYRKCISVMPMKKNSKHFKSKRRGQFDPESKQST